MPPTKLSQQDYASAIANHLKTFEGAAPTRRAGGISVSVILDELQQAHTILTDWEQRFVASLRERAQRGRRLSPKQRATLKRIYAERIGGED